MQWCCLTHRFTRGLAVNDQSTDASFEVQSKLQKASSLVLDLFLPQLEVARICKELKYEYRECIYHPMITVWMFISQVLSADHSCQQAVTPLQRVSCREGFDSGQQRNDLVLQGTLQTPRAALRKTTFMDGETMRRGNRSSLVVSRPCRRDG